MRKSYPAAPARIQSPARPHIAGSRLRWYLVLIILLAAVTNYLDRANLSIANSTIAAEFGLSSFQMGLLLSAFLWPYALANLPAGWLVDRFGPKKMFAWAAGGWSLVTIISSLASGFGLLYAMRVLLGVAESPFFTSGIKVTNAWFAKEERGLPTAVFNTGSQIANAIAPPILTILLVTLGWRSMFVVIGIVGLVVLLVWLKMYREPEAHEQQDLKTQGEMATGDTPGISRSWRSLFKERSTWGMIVGCFGIYFTVWIYLSWLPRYLEQERHLSLMNTGWIAAIPYLAGIIGVLVGGWISDALIRKGVATIRARKTVIVGGALLAACAVAPVPFIHSTFLSVLLLTLGYFGAQLPSGVIWVLATDVAPPGSVGSLGSIQNFGGFIGAALAPVLAGLILDRTGSFTLVFLSGAVMLLVGAIAYGLILKDPIPEMAGQRNE
ncbi:MFS transporter [Paramixta manurensis]|uniref:MFS transporter n=1 Tax=Paramixta manurensis TaxID=2740817 RepID=A0A6M8U8V5_9GAMM|nr:MFS transporter [Erwiniaceae bacterium PD-1]